MAGPSLAFSAVFIILLPVRSLWQEVTIIIPIIQFNDQIEKGNILYRVGLSSSMGLPCTKSHNCNEHPIQKVMLAQILQPFSNTAETI